MKKSDTYKILSAVTGAGVLLAGCAAPAQNAAVVAEAPAPAAEKEQPAVQTAAELEGVTYSNGIAVETFVAEPVAVSKVANVEGQFAFDQDVITPSDEVFNLFGTAVTGICASPAAPSIVEGEAEEWTISVDGDVENSFSAKLNELAEKSSQTSTMACACANNPAGGSLIANAQVTGIPMKDIVEMAGLHEGVNTVSVISDDGYAQPMPLSYMLERDALLVYQINGEDIPAAQGNPVQLWMPSSVAKYFTRRVMEVRFTSEDEEPALLTDSAREGEYVNRPNIGIVNYANGETFAVGQPITFEGYADDYDKAIASVEFSLDGGRTWTPYETKDATSDKWVYWYFTYTPAEAGTFELSVRSIAEDGTVSPLSSTMVFTVE